MDYLSEYLERYKNDDWFPTHWLEIDCQRLLQRVPESIKSNLTESEKFYMSHFSKQHSDLNFYVEPVSQTFVFSWFRCDALVLAAE